MKRVFFVILIFVFSCETVVELDIPSHDPLLVVNGIIETDSVVSIFITNSLGAFDQGEIKSIDDANVFLYENGSLVGQMFPDLENIDTLNLTEDYWWNYVGSAPIYKYKSEIIPQDDFTYSIEVNHPDYQSVYAETKVPSSLELTDLEIIDNTDGSDSIFYNATLKLSFLDNGSQNNYYRIRLYLETEGEDWNEDETDYEIVEKTYPLVLYSNDPSLSQGIPWDGYTFSGRTALFNDGMFNGQQKDISFDLEYKISQLQYGDKLFLQLTSFSEEGYNYFNSRELNLDGFGGPFGSEPVPIFSNIENGIGVFGSGNSTYFPINP